MMTTFDQRINYIDGDGDPIHKYTPCHLRQVYQQAIESACDNFVFGSSFFAFKYSPYNSEENYHLY